MCGRFALSATTKDIEKLLPALKSNEELKPRYNIAPTQPIAAILNTSPNEISFIRWGLIPFWAKNKSIGNKLINARAETLLEKPSFRNLFKKRRCLIIADGFYEWKKISGEKRKIPYFIKMKSGEPFVFAGLWDKWKSPDQELITSATIITTSPNSDIKEIHNRMPVIVLPEDRTRWLSEEINTNHLQHLLIPYPDNELLAYEVSLAVNNPSNDDVSIIQMI